MSAKWRLGTSYFYSIEQSSDSYLDDDFAHPALPPLKDDGLRHALDVGTALF